MEIPVLLVAGISRDVGHPTFGSTIGSKFPTAKSKPSKDPEFPHEASSIGVNSSEYSMSLPDVACLLHDLQLCSVAFRRILLQKV